MTHSSKQGRENEECDVALNLGLFVRRPLTLAYEARKIQNLSFSHYKSIGCYYLVRASSLAKCNMSGFIVHASR